MIRLASSIVRKAQECRTRPFALAIWPFHYGHAAADSQFGQMRTKKHFYSLTPRCPEPTCSCAETPSNLDIDHKMPMKGAVPMYSHHIVINTGGSDWPSRIEDEADGDNLAKQLKKLLSPNGKFYNPEKNILITNGSFSQPSNVDGQSMSVFPQCYDVEGVQSRNLETLLRIILLSGGTELDHMESKDLTFRNHKYPTVLICGHNSRDKRCGILGPLLRDELEASHSKADSYSSRISNSMQTRQSGLQDVRIGLVSHIGGHKWAGNMILYIPNDHKLPDGHPSPLAGKGIWYGRVEPRHIEGIVEETFHHGRVIEELLRGVHGG